MSVKTLTTPISSCWLPILSHPIPHPASCDLGHRSSGVWVLMGACVSLPSGAVSIEWHGVDWHGYGQRFSALALALSPWAVSRHRDEPRRQSGIESISGGRIRPLNHCCCCCRCYWPHRAPVPGAPLIHFNQLHVRTCACGFVCMCVCVRIFVFVC